MIWDFNIRLFHILLIIIVSTSIITAKNGYMILHEISGVTLLCIVIFRIFWGFFGTHYAKFSNFNLNYKSIKKFFQDQEYNFFGHNPLGSISIISMLMIIIVITISGLFSSDDIFYDGPLVRFAPKQTSFFTKIHDLSHYVLYFLITIHLIAVIYYQFYKKKLIIHQMIDGRSRDQHFKSKKISRKKIKSGLFILLLAFFGPPFLYFLAFIWS